MNYAIGRSESEDATSGLGALANVSISGGKFISAGATFTRGKKDTPVFLAGGGPYEMQIDSASEMNVVFYDTFSKQAWLVDGALALLHLSRAWLSSRHARFASTVLGERFWHPEGLHGRDSALQALTTDENRQLRIFKQTETKTRTTRDPHTKEPVQSEETTESWWCFEDLVQLKWHVLEQIHDHLVRLRTSPSPDLRLPFGKQQIEGFEFNDIMSGKRDILPRVAELSTSSGDWLEFTTKAETINILGSEFGDLIRPAQSLPAGKQACGRYAPLPSGMDYLAAPLSILHDISKRYSKCRGNGIRLGKSTYWTDTAAAFEGCTCIQGSCSVNVTRF